MLQTKIPPTTALLLGRKGHGRTQRLDNLAQHYVVPAAEAGKAEEAYVTGPGDRYWIDQPIPRGWLIVHVQGDPEAITTREPHGYGSALLALLLGDWFQYMFGRTEDAEPKTLSRKTILIILGTIVVLGAIGYWYFTRGGA